MTDPITPPWALGLPRDAAAIDAIHRERRRLAVERARRSRFLAPRLTGIDVNRLDDPEEWRKIPLLTKEDLRKLPTRSFYDDFCIAPISASTEFWRSGGSTGKPLFYPRSVEDMDFMLGVSFRRIWPCIGAVPGDVLHSSFPLGIHPVGQVTPRSAQMEGLSTVWAGGGPATPSLAQLELIMDLRPTIFAAMPSYALHLANLAETHGIDLASSTVRKILVSAEPLTRAKREKIERAWGAKVYNGFGMTEGGMTSVEREGVNGMVSWTDLYVLEVIDTATGREVPEGEQGALVMTPLFSNTVTPFLRWLTGDIVSMHRQPLTDDPFSVFPVLRHALRTEGFFKVRGVNINHGDLEDFMFEQVAVQDFRAEVVTRADGQDALQLFVEYRRDVDAPAATAALLDQVRQRFELRAEIEALERGAIAREFEKSVKATRFVDRR